MWGGVGLNSNMGLMNDDGQPQIAFRLFDHHSETNIIAKRFTFMLVMIDVAICKY